MFWLLSTGGQKHRPTVNKDVECRDLRVSFVSLCSIQSGIYRWSNFVEMKRSTSVAFILHLRHVSEYLEDHVSHNSLR